MGVDWDKFQEDIDTLVVSAGHKTDAALASQISSLTRLTDEDVQKLFPEPADVQKLAQLMEIVKGAGEKNEKINKFVAGSDQYASVVLTLLGALV
ncbi:MAG: hypothetical protein RIR79_37 [Pseudomonadota bacterium]|jgi:predicted oxidoreductase (fatty acid repression mutant protein)